jgi:hypothetical protein
MRRTRGVAAARASSEARSPASPSIPALASTLPRHVALATFLSLAVASWPGAALAEPAGEGEGPEAPTAGEPAPPARFRSAQDGLIFDAQYTSSRLNDTVVLGAGATTLGVEASLDGPWLARWDLSASARGGLATLAPFAWLAGGRATVAGELGHRLQLQPWSPYVMVGGRVRGDVSVRWLIVEQTGAVQRWFSALDMEPRFGLGVAYLDARHSFRAVAFAQEAWQLTNTTEATSATAFGLSLGYDAVDSLSFLAEAVLATQPPASTRGLALVDARTTRAVELSARKVFHSGSWVGLDLALSKQSDQLRYRDGGLALTTTSPGTFILAVSYGHHLGR